MRKLLVLLSVSLLSVASCSVEDPNVACRAGCGGCCLDGVCQEGINNEACGNSGNVCGACGAGQACSLFGRCEPSSSNPGGGAGGAGGGVGGAGGSCAPETDEVLCALASRSCGPLSVVDRCGTTRSITTCGTCVSGQPCSNGHCVCQPESNQTLCSRLGKTCGTLTASDNCGTARTVSCGVCSGSTTCGGGGTTNVCGCTPETDAQLCARTGRSCGAYVGTDNCGAARTVASCGPACVSPNTCSVGQCTCPAETNTQFCARLGASCGAVTGTDLCGQVRSVASCGTCTGSYQTCGGGTAPNQCGCTPLSDADLCAARGKNCGALTLTDTCGVYRTVSCGTCGGTQTCGGGGTLNVCGCTSESDATFCSRQGKNCGALTALDNCGLSRTATCGTTCAVGTTCGGGGTSNVCGCTAQTDAQLCTQVGYACGTVSVTDSCGAARTPSCGTCTAAGAVCGANGLTGQCGVPAAYTPTQVGRNAVPVAPVLLDADLTAIHAVSATEAWLVSPNIVLRVQARTITPYFMVLGATARLWSSSPSDVWLATSNLLYRFNGTAWSTVTPGFTTTTELTAVHGTAADDVFVANATELRHFDGTSWSAWTLPADTAAVTALACSARGTPYVMRGTNLSRWNGLSYVALPSRGWYGNTSNFYRLWASPAGVVAMSIGCSSYSSSQQVARFDGTAWTSLYSSTASYVGCTTANASLGATATDNVWFGDAWGGGHQYTTTLSTLRGYLVAPTAPSAGFLATARQLEERVGGQQVSRFQAGAAPQCTAAVVDGAGVTWLKCAGGLGRVGSDGFTLSTLSSPLVALFAAPGGSVWLALQSGVIERRNAAGTTVFSQYQGSVITGVHGTSDSNVFVITTEGGVAHFDGTLWSSAMVPAGTNPRMLGVQAVSASSAWAWSVSALFEDVAGTWGAVALPTGVTTVMGVVAAGGGVWVLGYGSSGGYQLYQRTGTTWTSQRTFTGSALALGATSGGALTLYRDANGAAVVEKWVAGAAATTVTTALVPALYTTQWVVMPSANEVLLGTNDVIYRTRL